MNKLIGHCVAGRRVIRFYRITRYLLIIFAGSFWFSSKSFAVGVYQKPDDFLAAVFSNQVPAAKSFWITKAVKPAVRKLLGHDLNKLRVRYWRHKNRTAWIVDEIGKEQYITVGIVVKAQAIEQVKVLIFRESRGWEIRYPFFTNQFKGVRLLKNNDLSKQIDGVTGATLSVGAVTRLSRLVLYFHNQVMKDD